MVYKIAKAFKEKGYETVLIRMLEQPPKDKEFYNQAYDKVIDLDLSYFKVTNKNFSKIIFSFKKLKSLMIGFKKILGLKPYIIFGRAPISTPIALFRIFFIKTPFVYFPYDIRCQGLPTLEMGKKRLPLFEIKADRFCFEHSDGIMHKGAPYELNHLNGRVLGDNIKLPPNIIAFHPYCSRDFIVPLNKNKLSKKDSEMHFVYVGGAGKKDENFYLSQFECFHKILDKKIHIHFYFASEISDKKDAEKENLIKKSFIEKNKNLKNFKYFHLENPYNPKNIVKEISKYDFGIAPYVFFPENGLETSLGTGNKISTYLEAGLPFFYRKEYIFTNSLTKKYGITLVWPDDMDNLDKLIKKLDYRELEKGVVKMRNDFLMEKHFPRLENFVKEVVKSKKGV